MNIPYKVIIAGGRNFVPKNEHYSWIRYLLCMQSGVEFVTGTAKGADSMAYEMPKWMPSANMPIKEFPADWDNLDAEPCVVKYTRNGKPYNALAGFNRNQQMAEYADALIVFPGGNGTADMIKRAEKEGLEIRKWEE